MAVLLDTKYWEIIYRPAPGVSFPDAAATVAALNRLDSRVTGILFNGQVFAVGPDETLERLAERYDAWCSRRP